MDWISLFEGIGITVLIEILFVFLAPESWKEPVLGWIRRRRKSWKNPRLQLTASKQLVLQDPVPVAVARDQVHDALQRGDLWKDDSRRASYEFKVTAAGSTFDVRVSEMHDPTVEEGEAPTYLLSLSVPTTYNDLETVLNDLPAADSTVRRVLQHGPRFVESRFQLRVGLEGSFPLRGFFQDLEPVVLNCKTKDKSIEFDYAPGSLTVRAELDSKTFRWLKQAITEL